MVAPLNRTGDRQHCRLHPDGTVTTADGFRAAYTQWVDAGWGAVPFPPAYGGGGFPWAVAIAVQNVSIGDGGNAIVGNVTQHASVIVSDKPPAPAARPLRPAGPRRRHDCADAGQDAQA